MQEEDEEERYIRSVVELSADVVDNLTEMGWQLSPDGTPTHVAHDVVSKPTFPISHYFDMEGREQVRDV